MRNINDLSKDAFSQVLKQLAPPDLVNVAPVCSLWSTRTREMTSDVRRSISENLCSWILENYVEYFDQLDGLICKDDLVNFLRRRDIPLVVKIIGLDGLKTAIQDSNFEFFFASHFKRSLSMKLEGAVEKNAYLPLCEFIHAINSLLVRALRFELKQNTGDITEKFNLEIVTFFKESGLSAPRILVSSTPLSLALRYGPESSLNQFPDLNTVGKRVRKEFMERYDYNVAYANPRKQKALILAALFLGLAALAGGIFITKTQTKYIYGIILLLFAAATLSVPTIFGIKGIIARRRLNGVLERNANPNDVLLEIPKEQPGENTPLLLAAQQQMNNVLVINEEPQDPAHDNNADLIGFKK